MAVASISGLGGAWELLVFFSRVQALVCASEAARTRPDVVRAPKPRDRHSRATAADD